MRLRNLAVYACALFFPWLSIANSNAQPPGLSALGADVAAKDVISDAQRAVDAALAKAQGVGNALISSMASQLSVLTQNLSLEVGRNVDNAISKLRPEEANLLGQVRLLTEQLKMAQSSAYQFKDSAFINLATMAEATPFTHLPYFIQRIDGLAQVNSNADYHMHVSAYGITPGTAGTQSTVSVATVGGKPIPATVSVSAKGEAEIIFANEVLRSYFDKLKVVIVPVTITLTVSRERTLLGGTRTTTVPAKIGLSLFPLIAGTVKVRAFVPQYDWRFTETVQTPHVRNGDGEKDPDVTQELRVPGGIINPVVGSQLLRNPQWHCNVWSIPDQSQCGAGQETVRILVAPIITDNGTRAFWSGKSFHRSKELWMTADRYSYTPVGEKEIDATYTIPWGHTAVFTLPSGYSRYLVEGQTITKQPISLTSNLSMGGFLQYVYVTPEPNPTLTYLVGTP